MFDAAVRSAEPNTYPLSELCDLSDRDPDFVSWLSSFALMNTPVNDVSSARSKCKSRVILVCEWVYLCLFG